MLKSEFKKMSAIQFKQALCMELLRCEGILKEALPSIMKVGPCHPIVGSPGCVLLAVVLLHGYASCHISQTAALSIAAAAAVPVAAAADTAAPECQVVKPCQGLWAGVGAGRGRN